MVKKNETNNKIKNCGIVLSYFVVSALAIMQCFLFIGCGNDETDTPENECAACHGTGIAWCGLCRSTGFINCTFCNNKGMVDCPSCVNGFINNGNTMEVCLSCGGIGKVDCPNPNCTGIEGVECPSCHGIKKPCTVCNGTGTVLPI